MNKNKLIRLSAVVLLIINIALIAFIFTKKPPQRNHEGPRAIIIERLHFTSDQIISYNALVEAHKENIARHSEQIAILKNKLYDQLLLKNNEALIDSIKQEIGEVQANIENTHYSHFEDIHQLCTPDQEKYYRELVKEIVMLFDMKKPHPRKK